MTALVLVFIRSFISFFFVVRDTINHFIHPLTNILFYILLFFLCTFLIVLFIVIVVVKALWSSSSDNLIPTCIDCLRSSKSKQDAAVRSHPQYCPPLPPALPPHHHHQSHAVCPPAQTFPVFSMDGSSPVTFTGFPRMCLRQPHCPARHHVETFDVTLVPQPLRLHLLPRQRRSL